MDLSSLPEDQRQQLQQIQTQYQEHQAEQHQKKQEQAAASATTAPQQQQQQQYEQSQAHQSYYQSQPHSYDQSYQSYYQYQQHPQQSQQYAAYYNNANYPNAYHPPQQQQHYQQPETAPYHPPPVSASKETPPSSEAQVIEHRPEASGGSGQEQHQQQNDTQVGQGGGQLNLGYNVPNGLNAAAAAAAVAALSQLAGTVMAMEGSQGSQWFMNGGGYGSPMGHGPFMGPMHHGPMGGRFPYRGGGRRGGRGNFGYHSGGSGPPFRGRGRGRGRGGRPYPEGTSAEGAEPLVGANSEAGSVNQQPSRMAWCELCRVDCTSLEILEQHKNGKRHKKNFQTLEESKEKIMNADSNVPDSVQQGEGEEPGNVPNEVATDINLTENELGGQGLKRKMRGGGVGKRFKTFGGPSSRRSVGPTKPKVVIPLICDLCNVKCDTQEVFDRHVAGKKHIAKVKRFEGHQAMYGPTGVQALYPPNPIAQALLRPQDPPQQAFHGPTQGSYPPPESYIPPPQIQNPNPQLSDAPLEFRNQNSVPQGQQPSASVEPATKQVISGQM